MSWNRSNTNGMSRASKPKRSHIRVILILACVIGVIAFSLYFSLKDKPTNEPPNEVPVSKMVKNIKPTAPAKASTQEESVPKARVKSNAAAKTYIDEKGVKRYEGGARVFEGRPRRPVIRVNNEKPLFHNYAENQILALLTTMPGEAVFVTRKYDKRFLDAFKKSLEEPVLVNEEDSEHDKELKQSMNEVKADLAQRMRDGEDVCKIMQETYSELQRLSQVKRDIVKMARDVMKENPEMTSAQVEDLVKATNKMLEEKGCAPIRNTSILGKNFRLHMKSWK